MKENVKLNLDDVTTDLPYRDYYRGRNGNVAQNIALYLGLPYLGEEVISSATDYHVLPKAVDKIKAKKIGMKTDEDGYGVVIDNIEQVGKSILHPSASTVCPKFYSPSFAYGVQSLVLPGLTAFSAEDAINSYEALRQEDFDIRLKFSDMSNGLGQFVIRSEIDLIRGLSEIDHLDIPKKGVVLEANVIKPKTISVGIVTVGKDKYSFLSEQKDAEVNGRSKYLGGNVVVVKGNIENLAKFNQFDNRQLGVIEKAARFYEAYSYFNPIVSRLSFDCVHGTDKKGRKLEGITDLTARVGGTCPALLLSILKFKDNPQLYLVRSEVNLNYTPQKALSCEQGAAVYLDHPDLRITARINKTL